MTKLVMGTLVAAMAACAGGATESDGSDLPLVAVIEGDEQGVAGTYEPASGRIALSAEVMSESLRLATEGGMLEPFLQLEVNGTSAFVLDGESAMTTADVSLLDAELLQVRVVDLQSTAMGLITDLRVGTKAELDSINDEFVPVAVHCWAF